MVPTSLRNLILVVAVVVGLIGATALVAGYAEKPAPAAKVAASDATCGGCPLAGTEACCADCAQPACGAAAAPTGCQMKTGQGCQPTGCPFAQ